MSKGFKLHNRHNRHNVQRAIISKVVKPGLRHLPSAHRLMVVYISVKFHDSGYVLLVFCSRFKALSRLFHLFRDHR